MGDASWIFPWLHIARLSCRATLGPSHRSDPADLGAASGAEPLPESRFDSVRVPLRGGSIIHLKEKAVAADAASLGWLSNVTGPKAPWTRSLDPRRLQLRSSGGGPFWGRTRGDRKVPERCRILQKVPGRGSLSLPPSGMGQLCFSAHVTYPRVTAPGFEGKLVDMRSE